MEARAILRQVRISPQKGRLVADLIRGKQVEQAFAILRFTPKKAARILDKNPALRCCQRNRHSECRPRQVVRQGNLR